MSETRWISAADQLPENGQEVLVWMNGNFDHYVYIKKPNWWMYVGRGGSVDADIWEEVQEGHYWMPVPGPPHKGE